MSSLASALNATDSVVDPQLLEQEHKFKPADTTVSDIDVHTQSVQPALKLEIPEVGLPENAVKDDDMEDLFGDEDADIVKREGTASPSPSAPASEALSATERQHRKELEYEEDDGAEEAVVELKHAVLSIPNIPVPRSSDGNNWVIRMPNFVKLDPKPFHPDTYVGPEQVDEEALQADTLKEKSMSIKLEVENTIRWKWIKDENGQNRRQSNSRVIRWSDGSLSLLLGKELFDINQTLDTSASVPRQPVSGSQSLHGSQSQSTQSQQTSSLFKSQGLTYLVAQHKRPGILQTEAPITGYMTLRPTGMQSETHRMLVRAVGQKHNKVARLRMAPDPEEDPERAKLELIKQQNKKQKKGRGEDDGMGMRKRRNPHSRRRQSEQLWSDEDEADAIFEGSDDDEEGFGASRKTKTAHVHDDAGKKGSGDYQTDDFVVADESDENAGDSDAGRRRKRSRNTANDDAGSEVDALDAIEAKLARQQEDRRRNRQLEPQENEDPGKGKNAEEMDIESEEDEEVEDFKVRRAGAGSRKKRAITFDDDDEDD